MDSTISQKYQEVIATEGNEEKKSKKGWKDVVKTTTIEYSQSSSVHGIQYFFESGTNLKPSRILWMIIVIIFAILGIVWSVELRRQSMTQKLTNLTNFTYHRPMWNGRIILY